MPNIFFISDLHLGHSNIISFADKNGERLRPFDSIDEHDDFIIESINKVVKTTDRLVLVGDCVMNKKHMHMLYRINGRKTLVMGNHDPRAFEYLTPYFEHIGGAVEMSEFIVTHIPVHPLQLVYRFQGNIHGHLHDGCVPDPRNPSKPDPRYFNVCVEQMKYTPIAFEELKKQFKERDFLGLPRSYFQ